MVFVCGVWGWWGAGELLSGRGMWLGSWRGIGSPRIGWLEAVFRLEGGAAAVGVVTQAKDDDVVFGEAAAGN